MVRDRIDYPNKINWSNLAKALDYYKTHSFKYIEVPWAVPTHIMQITYPFDYKFKTELGDPVASGEQSFLYLQFEQGLNPGKYMTITPCFRDEEETEFNFRQFMKLELYVTDNVSKDHLMKIINICYSFLGTLFGACLELKDMGNGSFDIMCKGIELGSYGIREHNGHKWIYATGIAEPRASQVCEIIRVGN